MRKRPKAAKYIDHREAMARHAIKRAWSRHGLALSRPEYEGLCQVIAAGLYGQGEPTGGHELYRLAYRKRTLWCIWSPAHERIVTFLPGKPRARQDTEGIGLQALM